MEVYLVRKRFILPAGEDEDDYKVVDETSVFTAYSDAFKKFNEYRGDLHDEVPEGDLEDHIKDDDLLYATTFSGKSLKVWIERQEL